MIKTERTSARVLGAKRQTAPFLTKWTCPDCGAANAVDHETQPLNYPVFGEVTPVYLFCTACDATGKSGDGDKGVAGVYVDIVVAPGTDKVVCTLSKQLAKAFEGAVATALKGEPLSLEEQQTLLELALKLQVSK